MVVRGVVAATAALATLLVAAELGYVYFNRQGLPDLGPFTRFEFSTIGHIYDTLDRRKPAAGWRCRCFRS